ncbi:putative reductive dehalogenase (rdhA), partial [marine sediment metagenome]
ENGKLWKGADLMRGDFVAKGADRYVVGKVERFDQKYEMFSRIRWALPAVCRKLFFTTKMPDETKSGYTLHDAAFRNAAWDLERNYGRGNRGGKEFLYSWDREPSFEFMLPPGLRITVDDPVKETRDVKKVAKFFGASLVGVCELDRRWVYSHRYALGNTLPIVREEITDEEMAAGTSEKIEIPEEYKYAIVCAIEMNYELLRSSPTYTMGGATGLCYSKMAFIAGSLAQFIRSLGYKAIPMGNDTACSIPLAIDAGLGELGRNGLLITPEFGPRVRLCKVFTDLPLVPDKPIEFGVWDFCMHCQRCAEECPARALKYGEPTTQIHNVSNREGLLRWPINAEKCIAYWERNLSASCANCIRVCPFNKPPGWLHGAVRGGVKNTRWLDSTLVKLDKLFGYGKEFNASDFWRSDH